MQNRNVNCCIPPESGGDFILGKVVEELSASIATTGKPLMRRHLDQPLPSTATVIELVESLRTVLFPGYFGKSEITAEALPFQLGATIETIRPLLAEQIRRGLCFVCTDDKNCGDCTHRAFDITGRFLEHLPELRRLLLLDALAGYEGDPAATSPDEAIFCYPGMLAVTNFRIANELHRLGVPLLPRMITEHAHSITGIDIHPGATIGERFFIDHGTGVVIGETCIIGNNVRLYQGVTLGAKSFPLDAEGNPIKGIPRHPIVEDDVIIYAGATVLGRITIGKGSSIGGNVWLTHDVPAGSKVTQANAG